MSTSQSFSFLLPRSVSVHEVSLPAGKEVKCTVFPLRFSSSGQFRRLSVDWSCGRCAQQRIFRKKLLTTFRRSYSVRPSEFVDVCAIAERQNPSLNKRDISAEPQKPIEDFKAGSVLGSSAGNDGAQQEVIVLKKKGTLPMARMALLATTFCWATYNPVVRVIYTRLSPDILPSTLNLYRSLLAAFAYFPFVLYSMLQNHDRNQEDNVKTDWKALWRDGIYLGILSFFGNALNASGLKLIPASRASFLNSFNIIFVPVLTAIFATIASRFPAVTELFPIGRKVSPPSPAVAAIPKPSSKPPSLGRTAWIACLLALVGATLISQERQMVALNAAWASSLVVPFSILPQLKVWGSLSMQTVGILPQVLGNIRNGWSLGDLLAIGSAFFYAMHVCLLGAVTAYHSSLNLAMVKRLVITTMSIFWMLFDGQKAELASSAASRAFPTGGALLAISFLGLVPSSLATWLQNFGQNTVPAPEAVIIYAIQPVMAAGIAYLLMKETMGAVGWFGAVVLLTAVILAQRSKNLKRKLQEQLDGEEQEKLRRAGSGLDPEGAPANPGPS